MSKQICTFDEAELKYFCSSYKPPQQKSLALFVEWQKNILIEKQKKALADSIKSGKKVRTISINSSRGSYGLKHCVERLSRLLEIIDPNTYQYEYVSNEDLIVALVQSGFRAKNTYKWYSDYRRQQPGPNYFFNIGPMKEEHSIATYKINRKGEKKYPNKWFNTCIKDMLNIDSAEIASNNFI